MNMIPLPLLILADGWEDIIGSLVGLVFLILWVVGQFAGAKKEEKKQIAAQPAERKPAPRPGQPRPPEQKAEPVRAQGAAAPDPLRNQVEEFLRRAGRQPQAEQPRAGQAQPAPAARGRQRPAAARRDEIEVLVPDQPVARREPLAKPLRPTERPAAAGRRPPSAQKPRPAAKRRGLRDHESVAEHVTDHISSSARELADHSVLLGQRVVQADEQFDVQLQSKFDHEVGTLGERHAQRMKEEAQKKPVAPTPAAQIAAMLTHPEGVRQAIILNEILRRPSER